MNGASEPGRPALLADSYRLRSSTPTGQRLAATSTASRGQRRPPSRSPVALLAVAYILLVGASYEHLISPNFAYLGYTYHEPPWDVRALCFLLGVAPLTWMPSRLDRPTKLVYWLVYLLVVAPAAVIAPAVVSQRSGWWVVHYAVIVVGFALIGYGYQLDLRRIPPVNIRLSLTHLWALVVALSAINYGLVFLQYGLALRLDLLTNLLSSEVTEVRLASRALGTGSSFGLGGYALAWQSGVLNPLLIAFGLIHHRSWLLAAGVFGQLVLFSAAANKSMLIGGVLVAGTIYLLSRPQPRVERLVSGLIAVVLFGGIVQLALGSVGLNSLLVRRAVVTPALLTRYYFEFFTDNPQTMLGQSLLSPVVAYPYELSVPRVVGAEYVSETTNANANIFADAFANFGSGGVVLFTLLLGTLFLFIDSTLRNVDLRLATAVLIVPASTLINSAFLTTLLTHGIMLACLLLAVIASADSHDGSRKSSTVGPPPSPARLYRSPDTIPT